MYKVLSQMDNIIIYMLKQGAKVAKSFRFNKNSPTFAPQNL